MDNVKIEDTKGYQVAMSFKPFINPKCTEHMEIVKDMARSINSLLQKNNIDDKDPIAKREAHPIKWYSIEKDGLPEPIDKGDHIIIDLLVSRIGKAIISNAHYDIGADKWHHSAEWIPTHYAYLNRPTE